MVALDVVGDDDEAARGERGQKILEQAAHIASAADVQMQTKGCVLPQTCLMASFRCHAREMIILRVVCGAPWVQSSPTESFFGPGFAECCVSGLKQTDYDGAQPQCSSILSDAFRWPYRLRREFEAGFLHWVEPYRALEPKAWGAVSIISGHPNTLKHITQIFAEETSVNTCRISRNRWWQRAETLVAGDSG